MAEHHINPEKLYFNYQGRFPPLPLEAEPAAIPPETDKTHPKLITDTTLRDGAQDPHFAVFPSETRLKYLRPAPSTGQRHGAHRAGGGLHISEAGPVGVGPPPGKGVPVSPGDHLDQGASQGHQDAGGRIPRQDKGDGDARLQLRPPHLRQAGTPEQGGCGGEIPLSHNDRL